MRKRQSMLNIRYLEEGSEHHLHSECAEPDHLFQTLDQDTLVEDMGTAAFSLGHEE